MVEENAITRLEILIESLQECVGHCGQELGDLKACIATDREIITELTNLLPGKAKQLNDSYPEFWKKHRKKMLPEFDDRRLLGQAGFK